MKLLSESDFKALSDKAAQVDTLTAQLAAVRAEVEKANTERDQFKAAAESSEQSFSAEKARADKAEADLKTAGEAHKAAIAAMEADVETRASAKAAAICAGAGIPPVAIVPGSGTKDGSLSAQLDQISDPLTRAKFIKENRAALLKEAANALRKT